MQSTCWGHLVRGYRCRHPQGAGPGNHYGHFEVPQGDSLPAGQRVTRLRNPVRDSCWSAAASRHEAWVRSGMTTGSGMVAYLLLGELSFLLMPRASATMPDLPAGRLAGVGDRRQDHARG